MQRISPRRTAVPATSEILDFAHLWKRASRSPLTAVGHRPRRRGTLHRDHAVRWTRRPRSGSWRG